MDLFYKRNKTMAQQETPLPKKSGLYTRTGDKGTTSLYNGQRVGKRHRRIETVGQLDALMANVGKIYSTIRYNDVAWIRDDSQSVQTLLYQIMCFLFDVGSYVATPRDEESTSERKKQRTDITTHQELEYLESAIDLFDSKCPRLKTFILPVGPDPVACIHDVRTICRTTERKFLRFMEECEDSESTQYIVRYLNRLSDLFFALARWFNHLAGEDDVPYKKREVKDS
jgi:cob(I)alamin adenosyltransferase